MALRKPLGSHLPSSIPQKYGCCQQDTPTAVISFFPVQTVSVLKWGSPFLHAQAPSLGRHYCVSEARGLAASLEILLPPVLRAATPSYNIPSCVFYLLTPSLQICMRDSVKIPFFCGFLKNVAAFLRSTKSGGRNRGEPARSCSSRSHFPSPAPWKTLLGAQWSRATAFALGTFLSNRLPRFSACQAPRGSPHCYDRSMLVAPH